MTIHKLLNDIASIQNGKLPKCKPVMTKKMLIAEYIKIMKLEKRISHDDLTSHDDDINLINKKNKANTSIIDEFPNALLLEKSIFKKKTIPAEENSIILNQNKKSEDIWNILEQIKKDNTSETLDDVASETDSNICKGCGSMDSFIEDMKSSIIVCSKCGIINKEIIDYGPEWRQYSDDNRGEGMNRCGCPTNFFFPKSSQGTIIVGCGISRLKKKQKWNSLVYKERSLNSVFESISHICSKNNIPKIIVDTAKIIYKNMKDCKHKEGINTGKQIIIRGKNKISIEAACVFKACEINRNPRSIREIAKIYNMDEKKITKGIKHLDRILKNSDDQNFALDQFETNIAEDYIRRHSSKLKLSREETELAVKISNNCAKLKRVSDHNPQSVAAGALTVMAKYSGYNIDKKNIAKLFGTSDVTIGKIHNKIIPYVDVLVDNEATEYIIKKFKING